MKRPSLLLPFGALLLGLCLGSAALADSKQCQDDARNEYKACKATCQEGYQVAKDVCRNVSHDCAEGCRATRESCVQPPLDALDACRDACAAQLTTDKEPCKELPKDSAERDACVDAAQVKAFQCRDTCRENVDDAALAACRKQFKSCLKACAPLPPAE